MFIDVRFLSLAAMKRQKRSKDTVVVSILDEQESANRPRLTGLHSVLTLTFEDVSEEAHGLPAGSWDDEMDPKEYATACLGQGERPVQLSDAKKIVEFLRRHHDSEQSLHLVVHCHAGISRSAAVALWAANRFRAPLLDQDMRCTDRANPRLLRLLDKADGRFCMMPQF